MVKETNDKEKEIKIFSKEKVEEAKKKRKSEKIKKKNIEKIKGLKEKKEKEKKRKEKEEKKEQKKLEKLKKKNGKKRILKFTNIYYVLVVLLIIFGILSPKVGKENNIQSIIKFIEVNTDGTLSIEEEITFEKREFGNYKFELEENINENLQLRNVKVYEKTLFGKRKLTTNYTNRGYEIPKVISSRKYIVEYDTNVAVKNLGDVNSINIPFLISKEEWINNYYVTISFNNKITFGNEHKLFTVALPKNEMKVRDNDINITGKNFPKDLGSYINIFIGNEQFSEEYIKDFPKVELTSFEEISKFEEETFNNYLEKKKERNYFDIIIRKYITNAFYLIIFLIYSNYIIGIIFSVRKNSYKIGRIKEKVNIRQNMDLLEVFSILRKRIHLDKIETQNMISSMLIKLEGLGYIKLKSDYLIVERINSKKKEKQLNSADKLLQSIILSARTKNSNTIAYEKLENVFLENSKLFIKKLSNLEEEKLEKLRNKGVYSKKTYRVNFKPILVLIPLLVIFTILEYIKWHFGIIVIITLFAIAKIDLGISKDNYTKLGVRLRKDLIAYEKYLKTIARSSLNESNMNYLKIRKKDPNILDKIIKKLRTIKNTLVVKLGFTEELSAKEKRIKDNVFAKMFGLYPFNEEKEIILIRLTQELTSYLEITKLLKLPSTEILNKFKVRVDDELKGKYDKYYE